MRLIPEVWRCIDPSARVEFLLPGLVCFGPANVEINWTAICKVRRQGTGMIVFGSVHYNDVIMTTIASQITSLTIVYSTVYSDAAQSKHQSSASLAFVSGIHRGPVNSPHKWPVTRKMFPFDDVIMFLSELACSGHGFSLERKCPRFDGIFATDCSRSCHFDNFRYNQWRKFRQTENISVSVYHELRSWFLKPIPHLWGF